MKKVKLLTTKIYTRLNNKLELLSCFCKNKIYINKLQQEGIRNTNIHTHMTQAELNTLYDLGCSLSIHPKVLEIGSYLGASSCYLASAINQKKGHLYCVDTWDNQTMPEGEKDTFNLFRHNTRGVANVITPIRKNSKQLEMSDICCQLNMIFIDGDHSYDCVNSDYNKVFDWIVDGGIIAFHDCVHFAGVSKTIGNALVSGYWQLGDKIDNLIWLRKKANGFKSFTYPL